MAKYLGLFLFMISLGIEAKSTGATLMLRAFVPAKYSVEVTVRNGIPEASLRTNSHRGQMGFGPRFNVTKLKNQQFLVSVVHP
jgi:hypothetical protein